MKFRKKSFEPYTQIIPKPKDEIKTGSITYEYSENYVISASLEISSKVKSPFSEISGKLSFGASYSRGKKIIESYNWTYKHDDFGDYGIFGIKRTAFNYSYVLYEMINKNNQSNKGSNNNEKEYLYIETGNFWYHSKLGIIDFYVFNKKNYKNVIFYLENGEFLNYMYRKR